MRSNRFTLGGARGATHTVAARGNTRTLTGAFAGLIVASVLASCSTTTDAGLATDELVLELLAPAPIEATTSTTQIRQLDGSTVFGDVVVALRTNANTAEVRFHLDDEPLAGPPAHVATADPYEFAFDGDALGEGPHTLTAAAIDRKGRTKQVTARFEVVAAPSTDPGATPEEPSPEEPAPEEPAPEEPAPVEPAPEPEPEPVPAPTPFAATLYVAPSGSDGNDGRSIDRPLRTVQAAADRVVPGDVVALRGGVYPINVRFTRSGTASDPIVWTSYPGELAVFDGSGQTPVESSHRVWVAASWNVFQDFEVRNGPREGIMVHYAHDNVFRRLDVHHNHYSGILNYSSSRNLYEDIRTHDNYDRYNPSGLIGDDADGISISSGDGNVLRRVVAYLNSDDGIDSWRATNTLIEDSVAYGNGLGSHGNGNGIKAGGNSEWVYTTVRRSIAFDNRGHGFDHNSGQGVVFQNNTAFRNGGYGYVAGEETTLRNNLSVENPAGLWGSDSSHNGWELGITDPRFMSTDPNSADFLRLRADSPAIDRGLPVGLPYTGSAPDLGALGDGMTYTALLAPTATGTLGGTSAALR